jgi:MFS family permease
VGATGWQGLFWIDAAIAAACIPVAALTVRESRDPNRPRSIDLAGTVLIAVILVPLVLALSEGGGWGWTSPATLTCFAVAVLGAAGFVATERRVAAPLVDLALLHNRILVGATLAILIVAGTINALMYVLSLYFQDPAAFGMSPLEAGLATLPAAAAMILITPLITPLAQRLGSRVAVGLGFAVATIGFAALAFAQSAWSYALFVVPLIVIAAGLGLANGPASSASTSAVAPAEVGQASGISNMARYIGGSLAVAAAATVYSATIDTQQKAGADAADALAAGLSRSMIVMAVLAAAGVALALLMARHRTHRSAAAERATASAAFAHTIPPAAADAD